jgi:regulator of protease activity HflC (stomatin/prohibitin superfamily)
MASIGTILGVAGLSIGAVLAWASATTIPAGHVGVETWFGSAKPEHLPEGFNWVFPLSGVVKIPARRDVTISSGEASSSDLQAIEVTVAVEYRLNTAGAVSLFRNVGPERKDWERVIVAPATQETIKGVCAKFTAEQLITRREEVKSLIRNQLEGRLAGSDLVLVEVNITNFGFSKVFNDAIEAKVKAEQDTLKARNELERVKVDAEQQVLKADADRRSRQLAADATAYEATTVATAHAEANRIMAESLTEPVLRSRWMEKWDGKLPNVLGAEAGILVGPNGK